MKKNKMISDEEREYYKKATGKGFREEIRSGRTTAKMFVVIGEAMSNPGIPVKIEDHDDEMCDCHVGADNCLAGKIKHVLKTMELNHFKITMNDDLFLTYEIFEEV